MNEAPTNDWELIRNARGDAHAMEILFRRHRDFVFRLGWSFTGSRELAQDVIQEIFTRLYQIPLRAFFQARFTTWLYRVTINVAREQSRAARKAITTDALPELVDGSTNASQEVVLEELHCMLHKLSERQREVVVLRLLEGLSTKEAAKALGCRTGTVKVHLHRALLSMREILNHV